MEGEFKQWLEFGDIPRMPTIQTMSFPLPSEPTDEVVSNFEDSIMQLLTRTRDPRLTNDDDN